MADSTVDELQAAAPAGRLVHDPCEPIVVPGGPGRFVVCGRMRDRDGTHYLDTGGSSG